MVVSIQGRYTRTAIVLHWLVLALLVAQYVIGWTMPQLVGTHAAGWDWTGDIHTFIAEYGILPLAGLHVAAALYHHFIRRDQVLQRMLPGV